MKKFFLLLTVFCVTGRILAQTNPPVKLALISETDEALPAADLLTAKFSGNDQIQLVERDQIEKVYQEQGLSAANTDYLKLGHLLGADGILLLNVVRTPQATNLMARLIAVKPGVILSDAGFDWPLKDTVQWSDSAAAYLDSFLPKLTVLLKDAIPVSVVNLRSAISSTAAAETERQLKLLVIQRLSQERQLFVLERQKMQLLSDEKGLKADDSAFWDGSYLLEGVVDQNGYSPDTVTINARLTPPKGGAPVLFAVSGSRTNLTEVINQLAAQVNDALKIQSTAPAWNAADEAVQFFKEAQWALRWGAYAEAQSAADSAWALGKKDLECALVRVKAYLAELTATTGGFENGEDTLDPGSYDANNHPLGPVPSAARVQKEINALSKENPFGLVYRVHEANSAKIIDYSFALQPPDPKNIDRALHALEIYYEFSRNSPDGQPKILWSGEGWNDWHDSDWYQMGITDLVAASQVLQDFNFVPETQKPVADKLAELRAMARSVAKLISGSPTVHDSYFVGDRVVTHDELAHTMEESLGIFRCEVKWGCFWQETPEDGVALYRELLASPVFSYIHTDLWLRELQTPRLVGWNENDRQRTPQVWDRFLNELENSTNALWRLEARALTLADEENEQKLAAAFTNFLNGFFENRDALVANNVELLYLNWGADNLVSAKTDSGLSDELTESLHQLYNSQYSPKLEAMDQEYWNKTIPAQKTVAAFKKQKQYLADFTPYDFQSFAQIFSANDYTKAQAAELKPLIVAYKSNLLARAAVPDEKFKARSDTQWIELTLEKPVDQILNATDSQTSPVPESPAPPKIQTLQPVAVTPAVVPASVITPSPEAVTNAITVGKFLAIPLDALLQAIGLGTIDISKTNIYLADISITGHQWLEGKLLLNLDYGLADQRFGNANGFAIALFDPATEHWEVIHCPDEAVESQNRFYHRSVLLRGELFTCAAGQIQKYNFQNQQWEVLNISDGNNYELFAINGQLYAANQNVILEIIDGGKSTRILASTRRQPPASALDTQEWGTPTLFSGADHSLRVGAKNQILIWTNDDWSEICPAPPASFTPAIFPDAVLFQSGGWNTEPARISSLATESNQVEFCLEKSVRQAGYPNVANPVAPSNPLWKLPPDLSLPNLSASVWQSDLYLLADQSDSVDAQQHLTTGKKNTSPGGYNTILFCFAQGESLPQKIFFNFDPSVGCPPAAGAGSDSRPMIREMGLAEPWMLFTTNFLICGRERLESLAGNSEPAGYKAGIWLIPRAQLDATLADQKLSQLAQQTQAAATVKQAQQNLFAKYDRNHNGVIDPDEREAALDDPAFIASQLDLIDANHNGQLDPEELIYFDANQNKILEPKEQAGIEIAQHLLAERDLKKFAVDGVAFLNQQEFEQLLSRPGVINKFRMDPDFRNADDNQDGKIDMSELEAYLQQQLQRKIRPRGAAAAALIQAQIQRGQRVDAKELFKEELEIYWQNSGSATNP